MESTGESAADRIRVRQQRVETKKAAARKADGGRGDLLAGAAARSGAGKAAQRIADGMGTLDAAKARTIGAVTGVRLSADTREAARRAAEDERVQERLHMLQEEAASSGRANAAVQLKWSDILERNLPQELAAELSEQHAACAAILASKDALLSGLAAEMRAKDEEYVRSLQAQRDDIEALIARMSEQFAELSGAYEGELCGIESALLQERDELISTHKREIDALFEARRAMETRYVEEKLAREDAYARELADMQAADSENYQKLKVKLETDVAILEQNLEQMKFTYLLNTEKLEYNYRVLTERDNENKATLASQKQRLDRLKAALAKVQSEYDAADARFKSKNAALTEEYTRITRQYRELQSKFRHFEAADAARYAEVVAMHREEMTGMVDRLLAADRVITEQLLGWSWVPPPAVGYPDTEGVTGASMKGAATAPAGRSDVHIASTAQLQAAVAGDVSDALPAAHAVVDGGVVDAPSSMLSAASSDASINHGVGESAVEAVDGPKLRGLLRLLIAFVAPFVLDEPFQHACANLEAEGRYEAAVVLQSDAILRAIGCDTAASLVSLVDAVESAIVRAAAAMPPDDLASALESGGYDSAQPPGLAHVNDEGVPYQPPGMSLLRVLRGWVLSQRQMYSEAAASAGVDEAGVSAAGEIEPRPRVGFQATEVVRRIDVALGDDAKKDPRDSRGGDAALPATSASAVMTGTGVGSTVHATESRMTEAYWDKLAHTIPAQKLRVWKALERGLGKYKGILHTRANLMSECTGLEAENEQLRQLLTHYLHAPAATELCVPPTHTLRLTSVGAEALSRVGVVPAQPERMHATAGATSATLRGSMGLASAPSRVSASRAAHSSGGTRSAAPGTPQPGVAPEELPADGLHITGMQGPVVATAAVPPRAASGGLFRPG